MGLVMAAVFVITVASVESAIGLSIMIYFYKIKGSINIRFFVTFPFFEIIKFSILVVSVLVSVTYLTLTEGKVLGYTHTIKGPM